MSDRRMETARHLRGAIYEFLYEGDFAPEDGLVKTTSSLC